MGALALSCNQTIQTKAIEAHACLNSDTVPHGHDLQQKARDAARVA
jgi:hypothetical protein